MIRSVCCNNSRALVVDENRPHGLGSQGVELPPVGEVRPILIGEFEIRLVNQTRRAQRLDAVPSVSVGPSQDLELAVDQRHEFLEDRIPLIAGVAVEPFEQAGDLADVTHAAGRGVDGKWFINSTLQIVKISSGRPAIPATGGLEFLRIKNITGSSLIRFSLRCRLYT